MFLLLIVLLMRLWNMSVNKRPINCDTVVEAAKENADESKFSIFKGTRFLKGLLAARKLAKLPLAQILFNAINCQDNEPNDNPKFDHTFQRLLSKFVRNSGGGGTSDWDADLKSSFMGVSDEFVSSDFQWSQDYGSFGSSRENFFCSSMTTSYDDLAKNLDAHLAELDIDSFRAEDINSILNITAKEVDEKARSQYPDLLFSTMGVNQYLSMDSLDSGDLENGSEDLKESIANNCQVNKENYTIAFEDSILGSSDSRSSKNSSYEEEAFKKTSWNQLGNSTLSNTTNQSLDSEGSFAGNWDVRQTAPDQRPVKEASHNEQPKLTQSPKQGSLNLVKIFMKQRTNSSSSIELGPVNDTQMPPVQPNLTSLTKDCIRMRKKSMNDSGKCSTLSHHAEEQEDYQLDSLDVMINAPDRLPEQRKNAEVQTSKHILDKSKLVLIPNYRLPNLDFVHLENDVLTSQFGDDLEIFSCHQRPDRFRHILDWDSLLFLLSKELKHKLKKYPELNEKILQSSTETNSDLDTFTDIKLRGSGDSCDCESILSGRTSSSSNTSATRRSSDSGLGPNTYNFEDLKKLFVYEYAVEDEPVERKRVERSATMCAIQFANRKRVSFEEKLPKKSSNKSTSSIPRLIAAKSMPKSAKEKAGCSSKIPKLIKSPSKSSVTTTKGHHTFKRPTSLPTWSGRK